MIALGSITAADGARIAGGARRRAATAFHLAGVFLILLGGFGMLARLGIVQGTSWPGWVWAKVIIWGVLAIVAFLPRRFPRTAMPLLVLVPILAGVAAYMAIYKPL